MNKLHVAVLVAGLAAVAGCNGCGPSPAPTPDLSRSEVTVDRATGAVADGTDRVQVRVTVRDTAGNPVSGVAVTVASTGTGNALQQPTAATDGNGVATGSLATTVAESKTLSASIAQGTIASTATATFGPGPVSASASTVVASPTSVTADGVASATLTVTLRDASGNLISGKAVTLASTGTQNTITQPAPSDVRGQTVGVLRSTRAEAKVVTATADGVALLQQPSLQFVAGSPAQLAFTVPPSNAAAGTALSPAVQVEIQDAGGNRVGGSTLPVTLTLSGGATGAVLGGTRTVAASDGIAVFSTLTVDRAGTGYTLAAATSGLASATSAAFDVTSAPSNRLAFVAEPTNTAAGAAITPAVQVALQDSSGNIITTATATITVALVGTGTLSGTTSVSTVAGVATFPNLSINRSQTGATLVATASGYTGATSVAFNVVAGPASRLAFTVQPSTVTSNDAISPVVQVAVQDAQGNLVTTDTRTISMALGNNPGGGTLFGTLSLPASAGVAFFGSLRVDRAGSGYTLVASASGLTSAVSSGFDVTAGPATQVAFIVQPPASVTSSAVLTPALRVAIQDAAGNTVTGASSTVNLSLLGGASGAALSGTLSQAAVGGVATFGNLGVDLAGSGYQLLAISGSLATATSSSFAVVAGAPARLRFTVQPSGTRTNQPITPAVEVSVQDAAGNVVTSATNLVTLSLGGGSPGAVLSGPLARNATSGVAVFSGLSVDRAGAGYTLGAIASGLAGDTSGAFSVTADDVTGVRLLHHVIDDGGIIHVPADLSTTTIAAYVPDSGTFAVYPATLLDAGYFLIPGVPSGASYYLRFNNDYFDTTSRAVDLGVYVQGRPDIARADSGTYQAMTLTGMTPWTSDPFWGAEDDLQMYSANADVWYAPLAQLTQDGGRPNPGDTVFDQVVDYDAVRDFGFLPNLVDASKGDQTYFTQNTVRDGGFWTDETGSPVAWNFYVALERAVGPVDLTVVNGQTSSFSGALTAPPFNSLPMDWRINPGTPGSFGTMRASVSPNARTDLMQHRLFVAVLPRGEYGFYGAAPDLVGTTLGDGDFRYQDDQTNTYLYRDPYPLSWTRFAQATSFFFVTYQVPRSGTDGGFATATESAAIVVMDTLSSFPRFPLVPQVGPPSTARINGVDFFSNQTLGSLTPTIAWNPPATGTAHYYTVRIRRMAAGPTGGVARAEVARIVTRGLQVTVPPGLLQPGATYVVRLTAADQIGHTADTASYFSPFPLNSGASLSGLLTTPP